MQIDINEYVEKFKIDKDETIYSFTKEVNSYINENVFATNSHYIVRRSDLEELFYSNILELYGLLFNMLKNLEYLDLYEITGDIKKDLSPICKSFETSNKEFSFKKNRNQFNNLSNKYESLFKNEFIYHFSEDEVKRLQQLINLLREEISKSTLFEESHRMRLLNRLEKLQLEIHKKMSDLDRFWGLVGDAGVALGKFGKDAKPIVDRIKELTDIVWGVQKRAEKLSDSTSNPLLDKEN